MIAIQLHAPRQLRSIEIPEPLAPKSGESLVAVRRIGICGTDWHSFAGHNPFFEYPRILGHELGVEVLAHGPDADEAAPESGACCSLEPYLNNPESPASRVGRTNCCEDLKVLGVHTDGGMCPRLVVPTRKLHPSPTLSIDALALVETLCIGAHACERAVIQPDDRILVIGAGPIGLSAYQFAQLECENVVLMDVSEARLAFCQDRLSISKTIHLRTDLDLERKVSQVLNGAPTIIMDATGNTKSMEATFNLAANGGRIVFLGIVQGNIGFSDPNFHRKELTLLASRNAPPSTFLNVIAALESGRVATEPWITHRMKLADVPDELPPLEGSDQLLKAMVEVDRD